VKQGALALMPEHESLGPPPSGDPARPHRPPLVSGGFFVFLLVWPILWSNAKIVDASDPGRWVSLPTTVRFVEPAVILGVIALAYIFGRPSRDRFTTSILRWLGILGVAGFVGSMLAPPGVLNMLYGIYDVMVAFVLLVAALAPFVLWSLPASHRLSGVQRETESLFLGMHDAAGVPPSTEEAIAGDPRRRNRRTPDRGHGGLRGEPRSERSHEPSVRPH